MLISSEVHGPPCCPGSNGTDITWHIKVTFMKSCSNIIQEHQLKNETSYVKGLNIYLKKHTSVDSIVRRVDKELTPINEDTWALCILYQNEKNR